MLLSPPLPPQMLVVSPEWVDAQRLEDWLSPAEEQRALSFASPVRRRDWLAGRLATKRLAWEEWGIAPLGCTVGSDGPAPCLDAPKFTHALGGINWSLSHSHGWGAASWADTETEGTAGMDIQRIRAVHPGLAGRILGDDERVEFDGWGIADGLLLVWALKEAAIKARRLPWGRALRLVQVRVLGEGSAQIILPDEAQPFAGQWARAGEFWVARAVRPVG